MRANRRKCHFLGRVKKSHNVGIVAEHDYFSDDSVVEKGLIDWYCPLCLKATYYAPRLIVIAKSYSS